MSDLTSTAPRLIRHALSARLAAAVLAGKLAGIASRALRRGGGTALPGLVSERIEPALVERLAAQSGWGNVLITGTNGKTTTARLLTGAVRASGLLPVNNSSGSNLMRGIATALIHQADAVGRLPQAARRLGVFEVDEATLPAAVAAVRPRAVIFTNLFRDQLDRYGEVDTVAARWRRTLETLPEATAVVLNADDPGVATLAPAVRGRLLFYGADDPSVTLNQQEHAADARWCPRCDREYRYRNLYYGHLGHWFCPQCGAERPTPQVRATAIQAESATMTAFTIETPTKVFRAALRVIGLYNVYNALAAVAGTLALDLPLQAIEQSMRDFTAAFGRQELIEVQGRRVQVLLGKNPAGMNQVLRALAAIPGPKHLLVLLNDNIADGTDVSWVWDVDYETLADRAATVTVSGTRSGELALRLKYAGFDKITVEEDVRRALQEAIRRTPPGDMLYVIPTYTAMLQVRELLARWGNRRPYWEER